MARDDEPVPSVRLAPALLLLGSVGALTGCGSTGAPESQAGFDPATTTVEYRPGLAADLYESPDAAPRAVVVMVPGGGWQTADRTGLAPLARALADAGYLAVSITYRAGQDGAAYPTPVEDVRCAIGFAGARAGDDPDIPIVVLGHSAGGHLAALAALADPGRVPDCPYPIPAVDALVGLAGVYDTAAFESALVDFFGSSRAQAPETWAAGDPIARAEAGDGPDDLQVLLLHGAEDDAVPVAQSEAFATALSDAGRSVRLDTLPEVTHDTVYTVDVAAAPTLEWLASSVTGTPRARTPQ